MGEDKTESSGRRVFLTTAARIGMAGGLLAGYGTFAAIAGRYLYPTRDRRVRWLFVAELERVPDGASFAYGAGSRARPVAAH